MELTCPCKPAFFYKSASSLAIHKKTKLHKDWEKEQENKINELRSREFETGKGRRPRSRAEIESVLQERIHQLEEECAYWRLQYLNQVGTAP